MTQVHGALYPHASRLTSLNPVQRFFIPTRDGGRWLCLYWIEGRSDAAPYSLYWDGEWTPVQHNMTVLEVFHVLADLLGPWSAPEKTIPQDVQRSVGG